jgi:twitching motility protein PilT
MEPPAPIPVSQAPAAVLPPLDVNINSDGIKEVRGPQFSSQDESKPLEALANPNLDEKLANLPVIDHTENSEPQVEVVPNAPAPEVPPMDTTGMQQSPAPATESTMTPTVELSSEVGQSPVMTEPQASTSEATPVPEPAPASPTDHEITFGVENQTQPEQPSNEPAVAPMSDNAAPAPEPEVTSMAPETPAMSETVVPTPEAEMPSPLPPAQPEPEVQTAAEPQSEPTPSLPPIPETQATDSTELPKVDDQATETQDLSMKSYSLPDLLTQAIKLNASDLHLVYGRRAMARVDGDLKPLQSAVLDDETIYAMLQEVVKDRVTDNDPRTIHDLDLAYSLPTEQARFRVNIFKQRGHPAAVFRLISDNIRTIEQLKLPVILKDFTKFNQGLVLVTGASGSGKSTTIASILNEINMKEPCHIVTIEDPIEYVYPEGLAVVDQRAVYDDTESWHDALRSVLRQDPDVVLIGEMRDLETISAALTVAETGHLVFATLHTNGAAQSIDRIIDVFPEAQQNQVRTQLASVLMAVVSQKLIPVNGGGRRVAAELMIASPAVRNAIRDGKVYQIDNMIQTGADVGMITMEKALIGLIREGAISVEVAEQYANNPEDLMTMLGIRR